MTYYEFATLDQHKHKHPIVLAKVGSQLHELMDDVVDANADIEFLTTESEIGMRVYKRSLVFLFLYAAHKVAPEMKINVLFPLGDSIYIESDDGTIQDLLPRIEHEMRMAVSADYKFTKRIVPLSDAIQHFEKCGVAEKCELFSFRRVSSITLYELNGFVDYFYGDLAYSTGVLFQFGLSKYKNGVLLRHPNHSSPDVIRNIDNFDKMYDKLRDSARWARNLNVKTVGDLNSAIVRGRMNKIILMQEAEMERNIAKIADDIICQEKKFILIAGPSSSGKTSFSNRLSVQLNSQGINCHTIACDDYFINRDDIPFDENGEQNFESIDIVDLNQFDFDMTRLMDGEIVEIPHFNFITGKREYNGKHFIQLDKNDIIIIEGIHCLNPRFLPSVNPYRIYISALSPLSLDEHNRISSSDLRMLRRMARDIRHRGTNPQDTIKGWRKVRAGEEANIFPYQENADVILNSSLVYEVPMMKTIVEPLLFSVSKESDEWIEAKRMLKFLDFFLAYPSDMVPSNSILQEFLGNSCFDVG